MFDCSPIQWIKVNSEPRYKCLERHKAYVQGLPFLHQYGGQMDKTFHRFPGWIPGPGKCSLRILAVDASVELTLHLFQNEIVNSEAARSLNSLKKSSKFKPDLGENYWFKCDKDSELSVKKYCA